MYGTALDFADSYDTWKFIWMFALQNGGRLVSQDLNHAELASPAVSKATSSFFDMLTRDHIADPKAVSWKDSDALAAFANGKAAMLSMVTPEAVPTLEKSAVKGHYAFASMPLVPPGATSRPPGGTAAGSIVSGDNLAIASYTKEKDLALTYIDLVTSPAEQDFFFQSIGDLPANAQAAQQDAVSHPLVAPLVQAENTSVPTPFTGAWSDVQLGLTNVVKQSLPAMAAGGYDPASVQQLLAQADERVQRSLSRQRH